ncbi:MAG: hypothetical protein IT230_10305 [Flavobacteriales bacterium]|nr:hypothetical protein [Flavobacteriales bacterium]
MKPRARTLKVLSLTLILLGLLYSQQASAQNTIGLRVIALTSAERDALVAAAHASGELKVVFACVPAGVIVFSDQGRASSREALRANVRAAMAPTVPAQRIEARELTLEAAEAACETTRGQ